MFDAPTAADSDEEWEIFPLNAYFYIWPAELAASSDLPFLRNYSDFEF